MARASRNVRKIRRLKRQRNIALRMANSALQQRNMIGEMYQKEVAKQVVAKSKTTITKVEDDNTWTPKGLNDDNQPQADRPNSHNDGLEVPQG